MSEYITMPDLYAPHAADTLRDEFNHGRVEVWNLSDDEIVTIATDANYVRKELYKYSVIHGSVIQNIDV